MRAVVVEQIGGPEVLQVRDRPSPEPGAGEVCVEVSAAGVNFLDVYQRSGVYPMQTPAVVGSEGAGIVSTVGTNVAGVSPGDRVAWAMIPGGTYAEKVIVPANAIVPIPEDVDNETAAAVMLQGITAQYLCTSLFPVQPGHVALVHAAAGGVGHLLTQMIIARGGRVIATTSTTEKAQLVRNAGAETVLSYTEADIAHEVRRLTDGRGVDVVFDGVGQATLNTSLDSLMPRGMLVLYGAASGPVPPIDPLLLMQKGSVFLTRPAINDYIASHSELLERAADLLEMIRAGRLSTHVGGRYPLAEAQQAHADLESRRTMGKLLLFP